MASGGSCRATGAAAVGGAAGRHGAEERLMGSASSCGASQSVAAAAAAAQDAEENLYIGKCGLERLPLHPHRILAAETKNRSLMFLLCWMGDSGGAGKVEKKTLYF